MKLKLVRDTLTDNTTTGKLYVNDRFWCYTLEDKTRNHKVYGETCIPTGTYDVDMYYWAKHGKTYPHLCDVPNFSGILIHKGSSKDDTMGCILVGMDRAEDRISNCAQAFDPLRWNIEAALQTEEVTIEIVEDQNATDTRTSQS
jgi:hypothetical protein